jgi:hypothetical protein
MTEQEELVQEIRERLGGIQKGALPFDLLAFATTIGQGYPAKLCAGANRNSSSGIKFA